MQLRDSSSTKRRKPQTCNQPMYQCTPMRYWWKHGATVTHHGLVQFFFCSHSHIGWFKAHEEKDRDDRENICLPDKQVSSQALRAHVLPKHQTRSSKTISSRSVFYCCCLFICFEPVFVNQWNIWEKSNETWILWMKTRAESTVNYGQLKTTS